MHLSWKETQSLLPKLELLTLVESNLLQLLAIPLVIKHYYNFLIEIVFETDGIDNTKPSNKEYLKQLSNNASKIDFPLYVELRECEVGESFTEGGKCV